MALSATVAPPVIAIAQPSSGQRSAVGLAVGLADAVGPSARTLRPGLSPTTAEHGRMAMAEAAPAAGGGPGRHRGQLLVAPAAGRRSTAQDAADLGDDDAKTQSKAPASWKSPWDGKSAAGQKPEPAKIRIETPIEPMTHAKSCALAPHNGS